MLVAASACLLAAPSTGHADALDVWHSRASGVTNAFNADAYGNGVFVVVGNQGTIVTSTNGVNWSRRGSGTTLALNSMVYADGKFVVVGEGGTIRTSTNGTTWTARSSGTSDFLYDVSYGDGRFIAVSDSGKVVTSTNGINWTAADGGVQGSYGVAYGNGKFIAVGGTLTCSFFFCYYVGVAYVSSDAAAWAPMNPTAPGLVSDLAFGSGIFVAVGDSGGIESTADGVTWTPQTSGASEYLPNVAYGHGTFVVVGAQGGIFTSVDGIQWTRRNSGLTSALYNIAYGNGTFLAVGDLGKILQSDPVISSPSLTMTLTAGQIQFSWPSAAGSFTLEQTDDLGAGAWAATPNQVQTIAGDQTVVTLDPPPGNRFYRLLSGP